MRWARAYFAVQAAAGTAWWVAVFVSPVVRRATLGELDPVLVALADIPLFVVASAVAAFGVRAAGVIAAMWTALVFVSIAVYATVTTEAGWGVLLMGAATGCSALALGVLVLGRVPTEWLTAGPFAFRPAVPRESAAIHVAATFGQIVVFWGFFLAVVPAVILTLERRWQVGVPWHPGISVAGVVVLVLASALGIWSAITMSRLGRGTPLPAAMTNRLVIAGPYRYIRNPMAAAGIVQGATVGLIVGSWLVVAYAVVGSLLWNYAVRPLEEADLESRFGDDFRRYRDVVRCWIPRMPRPYVHESAAES